MEEITMERLMSDMGSVIAQINDIVARKDIASARKVLKEVGTLIATENGIVLDEESRPEYDHVLHELLKNISGVIEVVKERDNSADIDKLTKELEDIEKQLSGNDEALKTELENKISEETTRIAELEEQINNLRNANNGKNLDNIEEQLRQAREELRKNGERRNNPKVDYAIFRSEHTRLTELIKKLEEQIRVKTQLEESKRKLEENKRAIEVKRKEIQEIDESMSNNSDETQLLSEEQIKAYEAEIIELTASIAGIDANKGTADNSKIAEAASLRTKAEELRRKADSLVAEGQGKDLTDEEKRRKAELTSEITSLEEQIKALDEEKIVIDPIAEKYAKDRQETQDKKAKLEETFKQLETRETEILARIEDLNKIVKQKLTDEDKNRYSEELRNAEDRMNYLDSLVKTADPTKITEATKLRSQADDLRKQAEALELAGKGQSLTPEQRRTLDALLAEIAELENQLNNLNNEPIVPDPKIEEYAKERQADLDEKVGLENRLDEIGKIEKGLVDKISELIAASEGRLSDSDRTSYEGQIKSATARIEEIDSLVKDEDADKIAEANGIRSQAEELRRQAATLTAEGQGKDLTDEQKQAREDLVKRITELEKLIEESNNTVIPENPDAARYAKEKSEAIDKKTELEGKDEVLARQEAELDENIAELNKKKGPRLTDEEIKAYNDEIVAATARIAEIDEDTARRNVLNQRKSELSARIADLRGLIAADDEIVDTQNPELAKRIGERDGLTSQIYELENRIGDLNTEEAAIDELIAELEEESELLLSDEDRKNHEDSIAQMTARIAEIDLDNENRNVNEQRKAELIDKVAIITDLLEQDAKRRDNETKKANYLENKDRNLEEIDRLNAQIGELESENLDISFQIGDIDADYELEETLSKDDRAELERQLAEKTARIDEINIQVQVDDQYSIGAKTIRAHAARLMELIAQSEQLIESISTQKGVKNRNDKIQAQIKEITKNKKAVDKLYSQAEEMEAKSQKGKISDELAKEREDLIKETAEIRTTLTQDDEKIARNSAREILDEEQVQEYKNQIEIYNGRISQIYEDVNLGEDQFARGARSLRAKADELMAQVAEIEEVIKGIEAEKNGKNKSDRIQKQQKQITEKSKKANKLYSQADEYEAKSVKPELTEKQVTELTALEARVAELEGLLEQNDERIANKTRKTELEGTRKTNQEKINELRENVTRLETDNLAIDSLVGELDEDSRNLVSLTDEQRSVYQAEIESANAEIEQIDSQLGISEDQFARGARSLRAKAENLMNQVAEHNAKIEEIKNDKNIRNKNVLIQKQQKQITEKTQAVRKYNEQADAMAARSQTKNLSEDQSREKAELLVKIAELRGILEQDDARREKVEKLDEYRSSKTDISTERSNLESELTRLEAERAEIDSLIATLRDDSQRNAEARATQRKAYEDELAQALAEMSRINAQIGLGDDQFAKGARTLREKADNLMSQVAEHNARKEEIRKDRTLGNKNLLIQRQQKQIVEKTKAAKKYYEQAEAMDVKAQSRDISKDQAIERTKLEARIAELKGFLSIDDERRLVDEELVQLQANKAEVVANRADIQNQIAGLDAQIAELDGKIVALDEETKTKIAAEEAKRAEYRAEIEKANEEIARLDALIVPVDQEKLDKANELTSQAENMEARAAELEEEGKARTLTPEEIQEKEDLQAKIAQITTLLKEDDVKRLAADELLRAQAAKDELNEEKGTIQNRIGQLDSRIAELNGLIAGLDDETKTKIAAMEQRKSDLIKQRNLANEKANELKGLIVLPDTAKLNLANELTSQADRLVSRAAELEKAGAERKLTAEELQEKSELEARITDIKDKLAKDEEARNAENEISKQQTTLENVRRDKTDTRNQISVLDEQITKLNELIAGLDRDTQDKIAEAKRKRDELIAKKNKAKEEIDKLDSKVVLEDASKLTQAKDLQEQVKVLLVKAAALEQEGKGRELTEEELKARTALTLRIQKIQEELKRNEERKNRNSKVTEQTARKNKLLDEIKNLENENVSLEEQIAKLEEQIKGFGEASLTEEQRKANELKIKTLTAELKKAKAEKAANQKRLDDLSKNRDKNALEKRKKEIEEKIEALKENQRNGEVSDKLDLGAEAAKIGDAIFKTADIRKELSERQISRDKFLEYYQAGLDMTKAEIVRLNEDLNKIMFEQRILITDKNTGINLIRQINSAKEQGDKAKEISLFEELRKRFIKVGKEEDLKKLGIIGEIKTEEDLKKMENCFNNYRAHFTSAYNSIMHDRNELAENAQIFAQEIERINAEKAILDVAKNPAQLEADANERKKMRRNLLEASITPEKDLTEEQRALLESWQEASDRFLGNRKDDKEFKYIDKDGNEKVIKVSTIDDSYPEYQDDIRLLGVPDYKDNLEQISAYNKTQNPYVFGEEFAKAYEAAEALEQGAGKALIDQIMADKQKYVDTFNGIPNPHKVRYETLKTAGSTLTSMKTVSRDLPVATRAKNVLENIGRFFGIRAPKFQKYDEHGEKVSDVLGGITTLAMDGLVIGGVTAAAITMGPAVAAMGYVAKGIVTAGNVVASKIVYARHKDEIDGNRPVLNQADPNALEVARKSYYREQGDNRFVAWAKAKLDRYITKNRAEETKDAIVDNLYAEYEQAEDERTESLKVGLTAAEKNQKVREARQHQVALGANVYNEIVRDPGSLDIEYAEAAIARNAAIEASRPGKGKEDVNPNAKQPKKDQYVKPEQPVIKTEDIDISGIDEIQGPVSAITAEQIYTGKKQQVDRVNKVLTMITTMGLKFGYEAWKNGFIKTEVIHHDAETKTETVHHEAETKTEIVHHEAEYKDVKVTDYEIQYDTEATFDGIIKNSAGKEVEGYYSVYGEETHPETYVISEDDSITAIFQAEGKGGTGISDDYGLRAPVLTDGTAGKNLIDANNYLRQDLKVDEFFGALKDANIDPSTLDGMYVSIGDKYWVKLSDLMQGMTKEVVVGSHIETQLVKDAWDENITTVIKDAWDETVTTVTKDAWDETITTAAPELAVKALKQGLGFGAGMGVVDALHEAVQTTYIDGNTPGRPEETMPFATVKFDIMAEKLQEEVNREQEKNRTNGDKPRNGEEKKNEDNSR